MLDNSEVALRSRIAALEDENRALRERLSTLEPQAGVSAEVFIAALIGGTLTSGLAPHDITGVDGTKFEVKYSRLNIPMKTASSRRWSWGHPLGAGGAKTFDFLILVAEIDPRFKSSYREPTSPYVLFDVPFDAVRSITRQLPLIQITTNPQRAHGETARIMFERYHVTTDEIRKRYNKA